ncbi:hypothetical protein M404DRAFT_307980 [Pisolithus tinctorius Marx 270]|uniref:Uncharacterized protein n=1 Tax=Pisolithus tinctorius Marx 270 TaxID=870435 RepID=A0A0C3PLF6_PISTI|nr:hypothetical protein M404DRAFT_307980 [Pisolithus tinctorius Marx 270]
MRLAQIRGLSELRRASKLCVLSSGTRLICAYRIGARSEAVRSIVAWYMCMECSVRTRVSSPTAENLRSQSTAGPVGPPGRALRHSIIVPL